MKKLKRLILGILLAMSLLTTTPVSANSKQPPKAQVYYDSKGRIERIITPEGTKIEKGNCIPPKNYTACDSLALYPPYLSPLLAHNVIVFYLELGSNGDYSGTFVIPAGNGIYSVNETHPSKYEKTNKLDYKGKGDGACQAATLLNLVAIKLGYSTEADKIHYINSLKRYVPIYRSDGGKVPEELTVNINHGRSDLRIQQQEETGYFEWKVYEISDGKKIIVLYGKLLSFVPPRNIPPPH